MGVVPGRSTRSLGIMRGIANVVLSSATFASLLSACTSAAIDAGCSTIALSERRVREIAIEEIRRRGGTFVEDQWEVRVSRKNCLNRFFAMRRPAAPGGHFAIEIDDAGNVVEVFPGY